MPLSHSDIGAETRKEKLDVCTRRGAGPIALAVASRKSSFIPDDGLG